MSRSTVVLPTVIDYSAAIPSLPDGVRTTSVVAQPVNLQTATAGSVIQFQLLNNGFLIPDSMYIAYTYTCADASGASIKATPAYMPFSRLDERIGSQNINTIQPYNMVACDLVNLTMDVAQKYGQQPQYGYLASTGIPSLEQLDSRATTTTETGTFSAPLIASVFANCEKLIPLFALSQLELLLTVDSIANIFTTTVTPTGFTLSNIELRYQICDMGNAVESLVRGLGSRIYIKSQSINASSQSIASGTAGSISLVYNQKFNSIKALFLHCGGASVNGFIDSYAPNAACDVAFQVAGISYPQRPLSLTTNRNGVLQELRNAIGSVYDKSNSMSINSIEFGYNSGTASTAVAPAKVIFGTPTRIINSDFLLTGISSANSPISVLINTTATGAALTAFLLVAFDCILEIDPVSRQAALKV